MGFKQRAQDKQIKAQKKELEIYGELLMDNQTVTFKQAHLIEDHTISCVERGVSNACS